MQLKKLRFGKGFRIALGNRHSQAGEMVIEPGGKEGGPVPPAYAKCGEELPRGRA